MTFLRFLFVLVLASGFSACRKKSDAVGKEVREAGYEMTADGWFGAVAGNDVAVMRKMAEGGFDVKVQDGDGNAAMHVAAGAGAEGAAEFLLNKGFPIDAQGAKGRTPLMVAVLADKPAMVQWLLRQGADPMLRDEDGFMPLMLAVTAGGKGSVEELAPYNRDDLDSALLLASIVGQAEVIDVLTNYGASVYARMEDGRTPLMLAAQNGHKEAAALLIDIGASRFATIESGETAQSLAVAAGHAEIAELIEKGFEGDVLALETDEQIAVEMEGYVDENVAADLEAAGDDGALAANDTGDVPWNKPVAGQGGGQFGMLPENEHREGSGLAGEQTGEVRNGLDGEPSGAAAGPLVRGVGSVRSLGGATVSGAGGSTVLTAGEEASGDAGTPPDSGTPSASPVEKLPLVMRRFRQRELPVEVKKVFGGVASLRLAGAPPRDIEVSGGEAIPGSDLVVVRVFSRTEQGKLNGGEPIEVGIVEVEDRDSGQRREWLEGRPASGHDPVALVEDAATGRRYVAKPGQKFRSEDGREFIVNDVRPAQLVIEDAESGEVRTLRLRGPRG
ncbi:ankyrin repeat domain-containing protein [Akkermansiaceae bacterium]|nr:ankyrin repeat domain-containing protein [Akkermansiaceae bacterium]